MKLTPQDAKNAGTKYRAILVARVFHAERKSRAITR